MPTKPTKSKKLSPLHKLNISRASHGKVKSTATKEKIALAMRNHKMSSATLKKLKALTLRKKKSTNLLVKHLNESSNMKCHERFFERFIVGKYAFGKSLYKRNYKPKRSRSLQPLCSVCSERHKPADKRKLWYKDRYNERYVICPICEIKL